MDYYKPTGDSMFACPECKTPLWEWIDGDRIRILGVNAQDYEIGFIYINLTCKKCGKKIKETSGVAESLMDISDDIRKSTGAKFTSTGIEHKPFIRLNSVERKKLYEKLSENQKKILDFLLKENMFGNENKEEAIEKIAAYTNLSLKNVKEHIAFIKKEAQKIKPDFFGYVMKVAVDSNETGDF